MNKIIKLLSIQFSLIFLCFVTTNFISSIYAQEFEFNAEDYFSSEQTPANSKDTVTPTDSEDTDKENCIDNPLNSLSSPNSDIGSDFLLVRFSLYKKI